LRKKTLGTIAIILSIIASLTIIFGNPFDLLNQNEVDQKMREELISKIELYISELEKATPKTTTGIKISGEVSNSTFDNITFKNLGKGFDIEGSLKDSNISNIKSENTDVTFDVSGVLEDVNIINVEIKNENERAQLIDSLKELNLQLKNNPDDKTRIENTLGKIKTAFEYLGPIASLAKNVVQAFL